MLTETSPSRQKRTLDEATSSTDSTHHADHKKVKLQESEISDELIIHPPGIAEVVFQESDETVVIKSVDQQQEDDLLLIDDNEIIEDMKLDQLNVGEGDEQQPQEIIQEEPVSQVRIVEKSDVRSDRKENSQLISVRSLIGTRDAGLIIGKQGKNITEIRESSNTKITVSEQIANAVDRVLTVTGDLEGISMAFSLIAAKLIETVAPASKSAAVIKLLVPSSRMGTIIGSKGVKIKEIHETSGARVSASESELPGSTERAVIINGDQVAIYKAAYQVCQILLENAGRDRSISVVPYTPRAVGGPRGPFNYEYPYHPSPEQRQPFYPPARIPYYPPMYPYPQQQPHQYNSYAPPMGRYPILPPPPPLHNNDNMIYIPNELVGAIIGKAGCKINEIRMKTGASIKIEGMVPGQLQRGVHVYGGDELGAIRILKERLEMERIDSKKKKYY